MWNLTKACIELTNLILNLKLDSLFIGLKVLFEKADALKMGNHMKWKNQKFIKIERNKSQRFIVRIRRIIMISIPSPRSKTRNRN